MPTRLPPLALETVYAHAKGDADAYTIRIESDPDCDGANACFLGMLRVKHGGMPSFPEVVKLGGDRDWQVQADKLRGIVFNGSHRVEVRSRPLHCATQSPY